MWYSIVRQCSWTILVYELQGAIASIDPLAHDLFVYLRHHRKATFLR